MSIEYGECIYCDEGTVHPIADLNINGECPDHAGESMMDEDEAEDWDSFIENINKDG